MTRVALFHPSDLLAEELKYEIENRAALAADLRLYSTLEEEIGQLTQSRGAATVVQRYDEGDLEGVDLAFFCGPIALNRPLLAQLPAATTAIVLSPDAEPGDGEPIVSGVNLETVSAGGVYLSPSPGVVLLTQLASALTPLGLLEVVATVIEPASIHGKEALDELFEQTRALLAFASEKPQSIFGRQLAFNLFPFHAPATGWEEMVRRAIGPTAPALRAQRLQGGIFHAVSGSLCLSFGSAVGATAVRAALAENARFDFGADEAPSPVDAASRSEILLGEPTQATGDGRSVWLWATMDNLTLGGAVNAADIGEAVMVARRDHPSS